MAVTELKLKLGALIRVYLKHSKLRQLDFARALNVSASAVSQMLSGRMVPSLAQLDIICQKLALDRNQTAELRDCLTRIRTGEAHISSPLNDFLKSARIRRGLSISQLSNLTGIPAKDISTLETKVGVRPSPTEAVRLAAVLECEIAELWQSTPPPQYYPNPLELREHGAYQAKPAKNVPVVRLNSLSAFDSQFDTPQEFAWRHLIGVSQAADSDLMVVRAPGPMLGWPPRYELELLVAPEMPGEPGLAVLTPTPAGIELGEIGQDGAALMLRDGTQLEAPPWRWPVKGMSVHMEQTAHAEEKHDL